MTNQTKEELKKALNDIDGLDWKEQVVAVFDNLINEKIEKVNNLETIDGSITDGFKRVVITILKE